MQVKVLRAAVQQSIDITNSTTFLQRFKSMIMIPINRRALGSYPSVPLLPSPLNKIFNIQ